MSAPYDPELRRIAQAVAQEQRIGLVEGTYAGVSGPSYETPAEIRMLRWLGADAVGMSTVPEVVAARAAGVRCLAISIITNLAAGLAAGRLAHEEVMIAAREAAGRLERIIAGVIARL
jgi:purine-nucleoside phosphorylase